MNHQAFDQWISGLDIEFWGTAQHKITPARFFERRHKENAVLLDLRDPQELEYLALPFALHIPINELPTRRHQVPEDRLVALFCSSGVRSAVAFAYLRFYGLDNVRIMDGGYEKLVAEFKPGKIHKRAQG